jgi:hypothetical protein
VKGKNQALQRHSWCQTSKHVRRRDRSEALPVTGSRRAKSIKRYRRPRSLRAFVAPMVRTSPSIRASSQAKVYIIDNIRL